MMPAACHLLQGDPLWRLPLYAPYRKLLDSKVADLSSTGGEGAQGGAIIAALFLQVRATLGGLMT